MAMSKLEGLGEKIAKKVEDTLEKRLGSAGKKMTGEALAAPGGVFYRKSGGTALWRDGERASPRKKDGYARRPE